VHRPLRRPGLHRGPADPLRAPALGQGRGHVRRLRRRRFRRQQLRRIDDGAQPGPLDGPLRGAVRREHHRAAEAL
ncbi:MAG: Preprotein translocase subunit SecG, partial [uncultured Solirubrobacteraceae bacterium]